MRFPISILVLLLSGAIIPACDSGKPREGTLAGDSVGQLAPPGDTSASAQAAAVDTSGPVITHAATIKTEKGDITIGLYGLDAPKTVQNFIGLASRDFYDGIAFHRVVPEFVIQAGDPKSRDPELYQEWGTGGESFYGAEFEDELDPNLPSGRIGYVRGTVAMANRGPNTNTSQFFIVLTDEGGAGLQYAYTIFGTVLSGMDVAEKIEKAAVDDRGDPVQMSRNVVRIQDVTVREATPTIN